MKYEMKAQLERKDWIVFSFFASVLVDIKNMEFLGKRNLLSRGIVHNLYILKGDLNREKLIYFKTKTKKINKKVGRICY